MAHAEFEEREFETPLYHQLKIGNHQVWSPGQVLEHHVGFDYSALCVDSFFWAIHGLKQPLDGFLLEEMLRRRIWRPSRFNRPLPSFALNLFLQAKRPQVRRRLTKALKVSGLGSPYWRIAIDPRQQQTLEALHHATAGKSLVYYATAAFDRLSQLYAHTANGTIVSTSSFPQAMWLAGHDGWNYDKPGAIGIANQTTRRIEGPPLEVQVEGHLREFSNIQDRGYEANLGILGEAVILTAEESAKATPERTALFFQRASEVDESMSGLSLPRYSESIRNFLKVLAFASTNNLQWYVLG